MPVTSTRCRKRRTPAVTGWPNGSGQRIEPLAGRYRDLIVRTYGAERGGATRFIEAFEVSEYGAPLDAAFPRRLFPFLPEGSPVDFSVHPEGLG